MFDFAIRAASAVDPAGASRSLANRQTIKDVASVDVERELFGQLRSDATFTTDLGGGFALGRLGDLHRSVVATARGLRGSFRLDVR